MWFCEKKAKSAGKEYWRRTRATGFGKHTLFFLLEIFKGKKNLWIMAEYARLLNLADEAGKQLILEQRGWWSSWIATCYELSTAETIHTLKQSKDTRKRSQNYHVPNTYCTTNQLKVGTYISARADKKYYPMLTCTKYIEHGIIHAEIIQTWDALKKY